MVVRVESVSKQFRVQHNRPATFKESIIQRLTGSYDKSRKFYALRDITFSVEKGRALGIIGHNGAGKSTLLRLLCGLGRPTNGHIYHIGRVSGLLELGSGFHPEMTGRENLITGGILSGLTKREVKEQQQRIIEFSELEEFIDQPVRTYSKGMYLRLAFSAAIHFDPDVLILDEVLAVGDSRFQRKCIDRIDTYRKEGKTIILTSHDCEQIRNLCDEVLVLEEGRMVMKGNPDSAIYCYNDLMLQRTERQKKKLSDRVSQPNILNQNGNRLGTQEAEICTVSLSDTQGRDIDTLSSGDSLTVKLEYNLKKYLPDIALILGIYNKSNIKCFETHILSAYETFGSINQQGIFVCHLPEIPLLPGLYYINVGLYPVDWNYIYDYHWQMHSLHITSKNGISSGTSGIVSLHPVWSTLDIEMHML